MKNIINIRIGFISIFLLFLFSGTMSQSAHLSLREGDTAYDKGDYSTAEEQYRKASEQKASYKSAYNLANTLYKQDRFEESSQYYQTAIPQMTDDKLKAKAYHNLGNSLFEEQKLKESIQAYKESLRLTPDDMETKYNLQKTKQLVKIQEQQQQQQQQQNQENKDKENQDKDKQDQDNQDQDKKDQDKDKQDSKEQEEQKDKDKQDQEKQNDSPQDQDINDQNESSNTGEEDKQNLDKEDALKLLEVIEKEEKKVLEKMRRIKDRGHKPEKDW